MVYLDLKVLHSQPDPGQEAKEYLHQQSEMIGATNLGIGVTWAEASRVRELMEAIHHYAGCQLQGGGKTISELQSQLAQLKASRSTPQRRSRSRIPKGARGPM